MNRVPTVFGVIAEACAGRWLSVLLPVRPNGAKGWVRRSEVRLVEVDARIVVDLSDRRVTLLRRGRPILRARAAIGTPRTPTPRGRYYVNQRLVAPNPGGPYGPAAIGISAFSPVLTNWPQGGPIAIHGTNRPHLIGLRVSNGCVRIRNEMLVRLYRLTPAGTPVVIRP